MGAPSARAIGVACVANGQVSVGDWVRELPASHFQPCYCCLCRPPGGERPILQIRGIHERRGAAYLRFADEDGYPAQEYERVAPPKPGHPLHRGRKQVNLPALLRDSVRNKS